jgi:hypothetical protein
MPRILTLNAKNKNRLLWSYDKDLTGYQIIFRLKQSVEDTTAPLVEVLATVITLTATLTEGYFDIDLTGTSYTGRYFYEIEINDATTINGTPTVAPLFNLAPTACIIQTRLDN